MKGAIAGICVALAVTGFEIATGIDMTFGVRVLIVAPLSIIVWLILGGDQR